MKKIAVCCLSLLSFVSIYANTKWVEVSHNANIIVYADEYSFEETKTVDLTPAVTMNYKISTNADNVGTIIALKKDCEQTTGGVTLGYYLPPEKVRVGADYRPQVYQVLDFTYHINQLHALDFKHLEDDLGGFLTSCFQYKNIYFSIVKYDNMIEPHYTVNVDMGGCVDADKDPDEVCLQFINALDLNNIQVLWHNSELKKSFRNTKANKLKSG